MAFHAGKISTPVHGPCRRVLLCALLVWGVLGIPAPALARAAADVRVIVDVSASMGRSDPDNLRSDAVGLLLRMLPDDGRAGLWTYGRYVNMLVKYGASDALWKETAAIRTADLASVGRRSNLLEAVDRATWDRANRHGEPIDLVLLTDGHLDISDDPAVNAAQRQRLLTELAPDLAAHGFRVHTLALSKNADVDLLSQLSAATHGYHGRVESPDALPRGLLSLLGWVAAATTVDLGDRGTFRVAPGTHNLTVLRLGARLDEQVTLVSPGGDKLTRETPRDRVRWHVDDGYELVTLQKPVPGLWRFEGSTKGVRIYAYGDLSVDYVDLPGTVFPGELRSYDLALTSAGEPVVDPDFLGLLGVSVRLHGAEGDVPVIVEPAEPGRYRVNLLNLRGHGDYVLETRVWGPTFSRTLSLPFVLDNPLNVEIHPAGEGFVLWAQVSATELDHDSLRLAALVKHPPAAAKLLPLQRMPTGLWKLSVPGARGLVEVALDLSGKYLNKKDFSLRTQAIRVMMPMADVQYANMDMHGRPMLTTAPPEGQVVVRRPPPAQPPGVPVATVSDPLADALSEAPPAAAVVPVWATVAIAAAIVALLGVLWWRLGGPGTATDLGPAMSRLRWLASVDDQEEEEGREAIA